MKKDGLTVKSLHALFGAELIGADLRAPSAAELVARIESLMDRFALFVIRDQSLDDVQHIALSRAFGPLELPPDSPRREYNRANLAFHADSTFNDLPSKWSLLLSHVLPSEGGDTEFVDTRVVYDELPEATKARIVGLQAMHDLWHSHAEGQRFKVTDEMRRLCARGRACAISGFP